MIRSSHLHCTQERAYSNFDENHRLVFVSSKRFNGGVRKHGWIKPWYWRRTIACPHEMF